MYTSWNNAGSTVLRFWVLTENPERRHSGRYSAN
jgi:hypothetical protein